MFELTDDHPGNLIGIRATGTLTGADYDDLLPRLRAAIEEHGQIRALLEIRDLEGLTPAALWDEATFDAAELEHVERLAVVGDARWEEALESIAAPFVRAETRYFPGAQKDEAWRWLEEGARREE